MKKQKHFGISIEEELLQKFKVVCVFEGRSLPKQVWYMIKCCVEQFEKENGEIDVDPK